MMKKLIITAFTAFCLTGCSHGDRNISLRLKYQLGDQVDLSYHLYAIKNGDENNPTINVIVRMSLKVDSLMPDSTYSFSAKVDYMRAQNRGLLGNSSGLTYDYEGDEDNNTSHPVYKMIITNRGEVIKPFQTDGPNGIPLNYAFCQLIFPKDLVAVGDDWKSTVQMPQLKAVLTSAYHIQDVYSGKIEITASGTALVRKRTENEFSARYIIDEKTKHLISAKIEMDNGIFWGDKTKLVVDIEAKDWGFM